MRSSALKSKDADAKLPVPGSYDPEYGVKSGIVFAVVRVGNDDAEDACTPDSPRANLQERNFQFHPRAYQLRKRKERPLPSAK